MTQTIIDNCPGADTCRHCSRPARWDVYRGRAWVPKCDAHLAVTLRNIGVTRIKFKTTTEATIEVRA